MLKIRGVRGVPEQEYILPIKLSDKKMAAYGSDLVDIQDPKSPLNFADMHMPKVDNAFNPRTIISIFRQLFRETGGKSDDIPDETFHLLVDKMKLGILNSQESVNSTAHNQLFAGKKSKTPKRPNLKKLKKKEKRIKNQFKGKAGKAKLEKLKEQFNKDIHHLVARFNSVIQNNPWKDNLEKTEFMASVLRVVFLDAIAPHSDFADDYYDAENDDQVHKAESKVMDDFMRNFSFGFAPIERNLEKNFLAPVSLVKLDHKSNAMTVLKEIFKVLDSRVNSVIKAVDKIALVQSDDDADGFRMPHANIATLNLNISEKKLSNPLIDFSKEDLFETTVAHELNHVIFDDYFKHRISQLTSVSPDLAINIDPVNKNLVRIKDFIQPFKEFLAFSTELLLNPAETINSVTKLSLAKESPDYALFRNFVSAIYPGAEQSLGEAKAIDFVKAEVLKFCHHNLKQLEALVSPRSRQY